MPIEARGMPVRRLRPCISCPSCGDFKRRRHRLTTPTAYSRVPSDLLSFPLAERRRPGLSALPAERYGGRRPSPHPQGMVTLSSISPVAILAIMTARAFTSAGRLSPLGPRGITSLA